MAGPADAGAVVSPDAVEAVGKPGAWERKTGKRRGGEETTGDEGERSCGAEVCEDKERGAGGLRRLLRRRELKECRYASSLSIRPVQSTGCRCCGWSATRNETELLNSGTPLSCATKAEIERPFAKTHPEGGSVWSPSTIKHKAFSDSCRWGICT